MDKKISGYILMGVGVLLFALSYSAIRTALKIPLPSAIKDIYVMIAGVVIILVGAFFSFKKSSEQPKEIPIYEGTGKERKIVAIQRMGK